MLIPFFCLSLTGYNKDVRPILSENCFACHGPDSAARQANLRLDRPGWNGKKLLERVLADEMPPPSSHKTLSAAQKATLRRWVQSGAAYEKHWSFVSPSTSSPLLGSGATIDAFVSERLKKEGRNFSPEAPRDEWLRRASLDLTGLPPTLSEIDQFLQDQTPEARERVVDRLLKSPQFGETMATPWLDLARYGDSYGYQSDLLETVWPYRDWVVQAFNQNLPYDQFLTRQLAGDLLPDATNETRLATAFNRLHRMTNEGGSVPEEWRTEAVADRVKTFGTAFLGLTLECARCHDHKFDPITQKDYYRISAFFSSIDEHGLYDAGHITPTPSLLLPTREQARTLGEAREAVAQAERALVLARRRPGTPQDLLESRVVHAGFETLDGIAHAETVPLVEGKVGKAIQLDGENNVSFPGLPFTRHTPFSIAFYLKDTRGSRESVVVYTATDGTDTGPYGYDLTLQNGILTARMMRHWPGNAIAVQTKSAVVPKNTWIKVVVTYDGSSQASGLKIWVNNQLSPTQILKNKLYKGIGTHTLTFGQRFRDKGFKGGLIDEVEIYSRAIDPTRSAPTPEVLHAETALSLAREKIWRAEDSMLEVMTMEELPVPRPTYVLTRGAYDAEKTEKNRVTPGTPTFLPPLLGVRGQLQGARGQKWTRLDLARWLTDKNNPLTARVAVNRFWQQCFGHGLVETSEDFGVQGKLPSHPELLDYLATDFQTNWDVKRFFKSVVLSRTYRQSSHSGPRDPQNVLLTRGPSGRLSAETIRDLALAASGLLEKKLGGPPVSPYQPGDLWREANAMSPAYSQSHGLDLYRRSLYSVIKRTAPLPNMTTLDAPGREVCTARRGATSTPLQALILLNDPTFVEAARVLSERALKEAGPTDAARVIFAFRTLATRTPSPEELSLLTQLYTAQHSLFAASPESAQKLLSVGEKKPDPALAPIEVAAMTSVVQAILNLDATVWKR